MKEKRRLMGPSFFVSYCEDTGAVMLSLSRGGQTIELAFVHSMISGM